MPTNTRVARCVDHVKESGRDVNAYAVCQASTGQNYHTGRKIKALRQKYKRHCLGHVCSCHKCRGN